MKEMTSRKRKNLFVALAMLLVLAAGSVAAYFTSSDEETNSFTVGELSIDLTEPSWSAQTDITPNQTMDKDPIITNDGVNDAYVFIRVSVPKDEIITADVATGDKNDSAVTQLFQLNEESDSDWSGVDSYNDTDWTLIDTDTSDDELNVYVFAYAKSDVCTALATSESTEALFNSVTFCNAIEGQDIENGTQSIRVEAFGIQTENLSEDDSTAPDDVWEILNAQTPEDANGDYDSAA